MLVIIAALSSFISLIVIFFKIHPLCWSKNRLKCSNFHTVKSPEKTNRPNKAFVVNTLDKRFILTGDQVIELACNLAKTGGKQDNAEQCIAIVKHFRLNINYLHPRLGISIFLSACFSENEDLIRYFLDNGADVNKRSWNSDSGLYFAAFSYGRGVHQNLNIIKMLIDRGCGISGSNSYGYTPLHLAARYGNIRLAEFLLGNGADPFARTFDGSLPIHMAKAKGNSELVDILRTCHLAATRNSWSKTTQI